MNIELERKFLNLVLSDPKLMNKAIRQIDKQYLSSKYAQWFYKQSVQYFIDYDSVPTNLVLKQLMLSKITNKEELSDYVAFIRKIRKENVKPEDFEFIANSIIEDYTKNKYYETIEKSVNTLDNPDKTIYEEIDKLQADLGKIRGVSSLSHLRRFELSENVSKRLSRYDEESGMQRGITTGITELDAHIGGWHKDELVIILAATGEGKSVLLLNMAYSAYKAGHNIIFITMEMSYEEVEDRLHSLITGLSFSKIRKRQLSKQEKRIYYYKLMRDVIKPQFRKKFDVYFQKISVNNISAEKLCEDIFQKFPIVENKLYFFDIPKKCTVERIELETRHLMRAKQFDALFIDHLNTIEPEQFTHNWARDEGQKAKALKQLAKELRIPLIVPCQMSSKKAGEKISPEDAKYAKAISENADWIIGFKQTEQDKLKERIRLELVKHRHAEEIVISVQEKFGQMRISDYIESEDE